MMDDAKLNEIFMTLKRNIMATQTRFIQHFFELGWHLVVNEDESYTATRRAARSRERRERGGRREAGIPKARLVYVVLDIV